MVLPVTVRQSPCRNPASSSIFMTAGTPPMLYRSSITYFPLGLRSARKGVRSLMRWKSSMVRGTPTAFAMAIRWSTALVEPPRIVMTVMAFSNASLVMMSRGFRSRSINKRMAAPTRAHSSRLAGLLAGIEELKGRLMPIASIAEAMVLAVYIPPHAPGPGHAFRMTA